MNLDISVFSKCKEVHQMVKKMCKKGKKVGRRTTDIRLLWETGIAVVIIIYLLLVVIVWIMILWMDNRGEQRESLGNRFIWFYKLSPSFVNKKAYLLSHCNSLGTGWIFLIMDHLIHIWQPLPIERGWLVVSHYINIWSGFDRVVYWLDDFGNVAAMIGNRMTLSLPFSPTTGF